MNNVPLFFRGILTGIALTTIFIWVLHPADELEEMERRVEAYRMCMESAESTRCQMTLEDFIDYYDLTHNLIREEE